MQPPQVVKGKTVIRTTEHSYFSRLTDSDTFLRLALVETQRRGVEKAGEVGFVSVTVLRCYGCSFSLAVVYSTPPRARFCRWDCS